MFKVGDRVRKIGPDRLGLTNGKIYEIESIRLPWYRVVGDDGSTNGWQVELFEPYGPIRETTVTKREIVFGVHGRIDLSPVESGTEPEFGGVCIRLVNREGRMHDGGSDPALMTPDELDAAASVLTQIAAVLRENQ